MKKIGSFDVLKRMADTNNTALKLAPISNIESVRKVKAGTKLTIGVGDDDLCTKIALGQICGGFIFCDRAEFDRVLKELSDEQTVRG